jgi:hypothetical protein
MTRQEKRNDRGRFEQDIEDMRNRSIVSGIIHDELENFWTSAQKRLKELDEESMDEETIVEIAQAKKDLKAAVANRFGNPVAASCMTLLRGRNTWNGFQKDNYQRMKDAWKEANPGKGMHTHGTF